MAEHLMSPATLNQGLVSLFSAEWEDAPVRPSQFRPVQIHVAAFRVVGAPTPPAANATSASVGMENFARQSQGRSALRRLIQLSHAFIEDYGHPLSQTSMQMALAFVQRHPGARSPAFSVEPSGQIVSTWRNGRETLTIRFDHAGALQFALSQVDAGGLGLQRSWGVFGPDETIGADFAGASLLFG